MRRATIAMRRSILTYMWSIRGGDDVTWLRHSMGPASERSLEILRYSYDSKSCVLFSCFPFTFDSTFRTCPRRYFHFRAAAIFPGGEPRGGVARPDSGSELSFVSGAGLLCAVTSLCREDPRPYRAFARRREVLSKCRSLDVPRPVHEAARRPARARGGVPGRARDVERDARRPAPAPWPVGTTLGARAARTGTSGTRRWSA